MRGDKVPVTRPDYSWELPITLQAKTGAAIVVNGIDIEVLDSSPPPQQGTIVMPDGCGSVMTPRSFDVNLDAERPSAKPSAKGSQAAKKPANFPLKVSAGDPEQLVLLLSAYKHDVRFAVTVKWISEGETGSVTLDNGGPGYRVTGPGRLPRVPVTELPE
ncbi:hypothetical protein G5C65_37280 [Streptomyces sp. SB3404]|uniref:Uncharacterized protein n=1 Tax=Streptomyces boncukensis TaxID=2711219 RepID=A0A6G4XAV2_9ACTN|nr:hypothetical protein [Streptomyces boncukensis]